MGDFNRTIGNDNYGVPGNKEKISHGGEMVRDLVRERDYVLVNRLSLAEGGPWTLVDPALGSLAVWI